jgi:hypothetical protein
MTTRSKLVFIIATLPTLAITSTVLQQVVIVSLSIKIKLILKTPQVQPVGSNPTP